MVKATVVQFRRGRKTFTPRHFLLEIEGVETREKATKLVGKTASWKSPGKNEKLITGKISSAHGNNGVLRAIFEKGLPGQSIGTEVEILAQSIKSNKNNAIEVKTSRDKIKWQD